MVCLYYLLRDGNKLGSDEPLFKSLILISGVITLHILLE